MIRRTRALIVTVAAATPLALPELATHPAIRRKVHRVGRLTGRAGPAGRPARRSAALAPLPPWLPSGRVINLPGRGEVFARDSGGTLADPAVLLLHGWTASADLNFFPVYARLAEAYRVIAMDLRGHGRGMRSTEPFS